MTLALIFSLSARDCRRYGLDGDTTAISVDTPGPKAGDLADVWFAAKQWGPWMPTASSAGSGRAYGAQTVPICTSSTTWVSTVYMGSIDSITTATPDDIPRVTQHVRVALLQLATGEPVSTPVTRPYGCSVKY